MVDSNIVSGLYLGVLNLPCLLLCYSVKTYSNNLSFQHTHCYFQSQKLEAHILKG